jgi:hypothetical protein
MENVKNNRIAHLRWLPTANHKSNSTISTDERWSGLPKESLCNESCIYSDDNKVSENPILTVVSAIRHKTE